MPRNNKFIYIVFTLFLVNLSLYSANLDKFLHSLAIVESNNNPKAYNKHENAIGLYQIRLNYFKDAREFNQILNKYSHNDCYSPEISKLILLSYFKRYEPKALEMNDFEVLAKLHNGGCGWRNKKGQVKNNLDLYWNKVNKVLTNK